TEVVALDRQQGIVDYRIVRIMPQQDAGPHHLGTIAAQRGNDSANSLHDAAPALASPRKGRGQPYVRRCYQSVTAQVVLPRYPVERRLPPDRVSCPPRVGARFQRALLLVDADRADGAGEPFEIVPALDLVA